MTTTNEDDERVRVEIGISDNNDDNNPSSSSSASSSSEGEECAPLLANYSNIWSTRNARSRCLWVQVFVIFVIFAVLAVVVSKRYGPLLIHKVVTPIINWLSATFSPVVLAAIVFGGLALFPTILFPITPFKWVAGMTFGYGIGFLLILVGVSVGVSLPYIIGCRLFLPTIKRWLDRHPKEASIVRLAGDGDWFHQFRAIVLIRVAPFPFVVFNYTAVATGVNYSPYLAGSLIGMVPELLVAIYSGILIRTVAEAMEEHTPVSKSQMIVDGVGFCISVVAAIVIGLYAKGKLKQLQEEEEQQHQLLQCISSED